MYLFFKWISKLKWPTNTTSLVKRAQQLLHCLSVWYSSCSAADQKALQRVVRTAEKITRSAQPSIQDMYMSRCRKRAITITIDPTHPAHDLFTLLPSGKRYRSMRCKTTRLSNSFFPQAIRLLNTQENLMNRCYCTTYTH